MASCSGSASMSARPRAADRGAPRVEAFATPDRGLAAPMIILGPKPRFAIVTTTADVFVTVETTCPDISIFYPAVFVPLFQSFTDCLVFLVRMISRMR